MRKYKPLIGIVDDDLFHTEAIMTYLVNEEFRILSFPSAEKFFAQTKSDIDKYDLLISDINMPGMSGYDLCRRIRSGPEQTRLPIILITGADPESERATGIESGADDFISKPFSSRLLLAKIKSLLEIREHSRQRLGELISSEGLNAELGRFLSPNIATRLAAASEQDFLKPHRAEVTVLFVDIRGFTAFSEKAEPEEVMDVLGHYYTAVGTAALRYSGTLGHLAGDGIMIFFNDPEPIENHRDIALKMALEARDLLLIQKKNWDEKSYNIDFGMGLSEGYATIGRIGFDHFSQYSVIGTVANFASRLCHHAKGGQILVSQRFLGKIQPQLVSSEHLGQFHLKGIEKSVTVHNVVSLTEETESAA